MISLLLVILELSNYKSETHTSYIFKFHFKYLPITAETPKPIMNPHNNPKNFKVTTHELNSFIKKLLKNDIITIYI